MDNPSTFNQIIVLVNGKVINNDVLKKNIDNVVIMSRNLYINTKLTEYINHLRNIYFRQPSKPAIDYLESEIIKELAPKGKINKVLNELDTTDNLDERFKAIQQKGKRLRDKLKVEKQPIITIKSKLPTPVNNRILKKKKLTYKDIKPYLTKRQLELISETANKRKIAYKTSLLTQNEAYFNKELQKLKTSGNRSYLGNKHIKTKIGLVYRLFVEK